TREPADYDEDNREENHVGKVHQGSPYELENRNAADHQREIDEENGPSLPSRRRTPSPAVALGGKPVLARLGGRHGARLRCDIPNLTVLVQSSARPPGLFRRLTSPFGVDDDVPRSAMGMGRGAGAAARSGADPASFLPARRRRGAGLGACG